MPNYELEKVKEAARGRWSEIVTSTCGVSPAKFNGHHQACEKCGGKDRFRAFDNFEETGGVICNQCHSSRIRDGFHTIQWLLNVDFLRSVEIVAQHLGIKPTASRKFKKADPEINLDFRGWNDALVSLWCQKKSPVTAEAVRAFGGRIARYRKQWTVLAFPIWGEQLTASGPIGWAICNITGGTLPKYTKGGGEPSYVKIKLTHGSERGLIGPVDKIREASTIWKLEGPTDALAVHAIVPDSHIAITNSNGCMENPQDWIGELCTEKFVNVLHDADKPGQEGATWRQESDGQSRPGWAPVLARKATACTNVLLPYPVEDDHGKDVRDWLNEGNAWEELNELALAGDSVEPAPGEKTSTEKVIEAPDDPHRLARVNLKRYEQENSGARLVYWRDEWYVWRSRSNCYDKITGNDLAAKVNLSVKREFDRLWKIENEEYEEWKNSEDYDESKDKGPPKARKVTKPLVTNVLEATRGIVRLSSKIDPGTWLTSDPPFPAEGTIATKNGYVHLPSLVAGKPAMVPPSPDLFGFVATPFDFVPERTCPEWKKFLESVWPNDPDSILALQQWFGYVVAKETKHQKILVVIGPKRSGKGTIARVLKDQAGVENVGNPTLASLGGDFGLQQLFGKTLAIVTDARLSSRLDSVEIVEELLSISGEDGKNIHRKHLPTLTAVQMGVRFMIMSNEVPRLVDASSAITSRLIVVRQTRSFLGKEDYGLYAKLQQELPGILNWAIRGWENLNQAGRFTQPKSGRRDLRQLEDLSSPVRAFVRELCTLKNPKALIPCDELYKKWCEWCDANGQAHPGTMSTFGRNLRAACPSVDRRRPGKRDDNRPWHYRGIALKA